MNRPLLSILLVPFILSACTSAPHHVHPRVDGYLAYGYPSNYYDYHYYPDVAVYFHVYSRHYFYRHDGHWVRTRYLPRHIHLDQRARRHIVYKGDKPYMEHHEHRRRYGSGPEFHGHRSADPRDRDRHENELVMYPDRGKNDPPMRTPGNRNHRHQAPPETRVRSTSDRSRADTIGKQPMVRRHKSTVSGKPPPTERYNHDSTAPRNSPPPGRDRRKSSAYVNSPPPERAHVAGHRRDAERELERGERRPQRAVNKKQPDEARRSDQRREDASQAVENAPEFRAEPDARRIKERTRRSNDNRRRYAEREDWR